jgi:hypothetical protein
LHAQGLAQVRYVNFTCHFYMWKFWLVW